MDLKAKREKMILVCLIAAIFVAVSLVCRPVFYLNDDVTMRSILSGTYLGIPDGHAVYMKYPLTGILSMLYRLAEVVSWMELLFAGCLIGPVVSIVTLSSKQDKNILWKVLCGILFVLPFFWYMHYTIIAAVLAGTAAFLLSTRKKEIQAIVYWLLAWMIRSQIAYLVLPFILVAVLWNESGKKWLEVKSGFLHLIKIGGITLTVLLICGGINRLAYASDEWQSYLAYNEARTELFDYTDFHSTDHYSKTYEQYGMTEDEFYVLNSYNTILDNSVNVQTLENVVNLVQQRMEQNQAGASRIKDCVKQYYYEIRYSKNLYVLLWLLMYGVLAVRLIFEWNWKRLMVLVCLGGGRSLIWIYLIYRGRFPERISVSLYIIELLLLAGMLSNVSKNDVGQWKCGVQKVADKYTWISPIIAGIKGLLVAVVAGVLLVQVKDAYAKAEEKVLIQKEWSVLKEYCEKQEKYLYLVDVFSAVEYGGLQYEKDGSNLMLAGGWMSASPTALMRLADRNAVDGAEALYEDTKTLFLVDQTRDIEGLQTYLENLFGDCRLEQVNEIKCSDDKIFVVYRLMH